ncbi:hypothetical protein GALMADRAFT_249379 [Galerina marginata CBS 339.88]|uniref:Amino acid permease/ SLC12A domain-containing protein n=1 Tax=Galerina marginata (strain CBS 339.88) TaxID=685588 RepID=A0A067T8L2_GALM3|nr:hypothetical protein GALMADRAFT_249379 [Galerina marginata CBS 339.88]
MTSSRSRYQPLPTDVPNDISLANQVLTDDLHSTLPTLGTSATNAGIKRSLHERHLSMIALAGMIGTGLFLSSGKALANAGPLGCVLAFIVMGTVTASMAYISAEMSALKPVQGGFVRHAAMWLDGSSGIAVGWNFWYSMVITMPTEISAATTLLAFWKPAIHPSIPITILWLLISIFNFSPVRVYGEFEFYLAFCKIALILCFVIGGLVLDLGGFPEQDFIGFRYWTNPYHLFREYVTTGFRGRFLGFWSAMISAAFAYGGVQIVALVGAETRNPRKAIPAALKKTFARVVFFYVASIFVISLTIPANDKRLYLPTEDVTHSPFVIAFSNAGMKALPSIINAIVLSSAFSSGNAATFLGARALHGLALDGHAPQIFLELNRFGVPYVAVAASVIWGAVAYTSLNQGAFQAFLWLVSLVATSAIVSWVVMCLTYLRFFYALRVQKIPRESLPYRSPLQPYLTYYALAMNILVLIFSGWNSFFPTFDLSLFTSNYFNCIFYPLLYLGCKLWFKDTMVELDAIDIQTELDLIDIEVEQVFAENQLDCAGLSTYDRFLNSIF